jgi:hypothetical protein
MSEEHDDSPDGAYLRQSIQLEQVTELAPKPKRVYKKKPVLSPELAPPSIPEQSVAPLAPPSIPTEQPVILPVPSISTEQPVKEKKARTQKQIDAFNKMREAYLNKRKTPISLAGSADVIAPLDVVPSINNSPKGMTQHVSVKEPATDEIINELGTKKVQKPRAKKNKQVAPEEEPQINNSPTLPPVTPSPALVRQVSNAPRFLFV